MSIIVWIVLGALTGWLASMIVVNKSRSKAFSNVARGVFGAAIGALLASVFGAISLDALGLGAVVIAVFGSLILLIALNGLFEENISN